MKRLVCLVLLLAGGVLAFASIGAAQSVPPLQGVQVVPDRSTQTVHIREHAFEPAQLRVAPGTTVTWVNEDSEAHTVTADDWSFDSGQLGPGESYSVSFYGTGTLRYHCALHPEMKGSVGVGGGSVEEPSTAKKEPATEKKPAAGSGQPAGEERTTGYVGQSTNEPAESINERAQPTNETIQPTNDTM